MTGAESKETLYRYQWALNSANSFFKDFPSVSDGATDLKVEAVHKQGIKGKGVNVLVIDQGLVLNHEDLNVNSTMTWNFDTNSADPTPTQDANNLELAHGMNVAGIIAALQNGKGVMGIAPKVTLGGVRAISLSKGKEDSVNWIEAYGGASWSKAAHIINASYGSGPITPPDFDADTSEGTSAIRAFHALRGGKGLIMVKAAGNAFTLLIDDDRRRECPKYRPPGTTDNIDLASCETPANDTEALEPGVILVASANALGKRAAYSSAGSVMWVTGLGGEWGTSGKFGEATNNGADGPHLYSTDLPECTYGYSRDATSLTTDFLKQGTVTNKEKNPNCDYSYMNGTSAATPTVSGVIALILEANPNLTWRDVRDILRSTARQIDTKYDEDANRNKRVDLAATLGTYTADRKDDPAAPDGYLLSLTTESTSTLSDGDTSARRELGWQTNAAGFKYSNWYGFGLVDAAEAVAKAKTYTAYKPSLLALPGFKTIPKVGSTDPGVFAVRYGQVTRLATFTVTDNRTVDALQLRLASSTGDLCIGSVGIYVKSPSGTVSILSTPYNSYYSNNAKLGSNSMYGLGSYAFYGESANANGGVWEIFSVSGKPQIKCSPAISGNISIQYRIVPMEL
jgi:subtilisin family serine protease